MTHQKIEKYHAYIIAMSDKTSTVASATTTPITKITYPTIKPPTSVGARDLLADSMQTQPKKVFGPKISYGPVNSK